VLGLGLALSLLVGCNKKRPTDSYAPLMPSDPYPADGTRNVDHTTLDITLRWACANPNAGGTLTYDVYFDTVSPPVAKAASHIPGANLPRTGLRYGTAYYWRVQAYDQSGTTTMGPQWWFTTLPHANRAPAIPGNMSPADGSAGMRPSLVFSWSCHDPDAGDTLHYDVYLDASDPPMTLAAAAIQPETTVYLQGRMQYGQSYCWRVVARDNCDAVTAGPVARLTTMASPWFAAAPMPTARHGFALAEAGGCLYALGGSATFTFSDAVERYDPAADAWTAAGRMTSPRAFMACASVGGKIYLIGGENDGGVTGLVEEYDPASGTWTARSPLATPRKLAAAAAWNGKIYLFGGNTGFCPLESINVYDPINDQWTTMTDVLVPPKYGMAAATYGNRIMLFGGFGGEEGFLHSVDIMNPVSGTMSTGHPMFAARNMGAAAADGSGGIYVLGGYDGGYLATVERYNVAADSFEPRAEMLTRRSYLQAWWVNNRLYAIGGMGPMSLGTVEQYRPEMDP